MKRLFPTIRRPKLTFWLSWGLLLVILWGPALWAQLENAFSAEWILVGALMIFTKRPRSRTGRWGITFLFLLLLFWQVYRVFSWRLYRVEPNFFHDWSLLTEVLPIFWSELSLGKLTAYLPLLLGALLAMIALPWTLWRMARAAELAGLLQRTEKIVLVLLGVSLLLSFVGPFPVNWSAFQIGHSVVQSAQLKKEIQEIEPPAFATQWPDSLRFHPNIYLVFLESYGEILAQDPTFAKRYRRKIKQIETNLHGSGWQSLSAWSQSPISGGRSWLAFSSFMTGKHLYAHPQYTQLLKEAPDYPHLVRFLNQQGYFTLRMNTLQAKTQQANIPYALYERFFAFDRWLKYPDFPYSGPAYGKFGNLPDQYALGFARDSVIREQEPFFLFFITLNSHTPWNDIPVLTSHWTELEHLPDTAHQGQQTSLMAGLATNKYWQAMDYELSVMEQVVAQQGDSSSLFIFLGDHQPPFLTGREDGFRTPVHLFSQNQVLMDRFQEMGFQPGLWIEEGGLDYRHEDFYALLIKALQ
jgi:hypothetical protein